MTGAGFPADRHAVDVDGVTMRSGPGFLTAAEAGDAVACYVDANYPDPVAVTVRNYVRFYDTEADAAHASGRRTWRPVK